MHRLVAAALLPQAGRGVSQAVSPCIPFQSRKQKEGWRHSPDYFSLKVVIAAQAARKRWRQLPSPALRADTVESHCAIRPPFRSALGSGVFLCVPSSATVRENAAASRRTSLFFFFFVLSFPLFSSSPSSRPPH